MEIKTCEQYVLDQLEQARAERDWLRGELEQAQDEAEALSIVESLTDDSYQCFALLEDGTVLDLRGRFPGCVEMGGEEERNGYRD